MRSAGPTSPPRPSSLRSSEPFILYLPGRGANGGAPITRPHFGAKNGPLFKPQQRRRRRRRRHRSGVRHVERNLERGAAEHRSKMQRAPSQPRKNESAKGGTPPPPAAPTLSAITDAASGQWPVHAVLPPPLHLFHLFPLLSLLRLPRLQADRRSVFAPFRTRRWEKGSPSPCALRGRLPAGRQSRRPKHADPALLNVVREGQGLGDYIKTRRPNLVLKRTFCVTLGAQGA